MAATGQRGISLRLLQGLVDGGKDKGRAKETLCFSLHRLLIYLCPIRGNPCSGRFWRLKLQTRQFVQSGFITLAIGPTSEPAKMSHLKLTAPPEPGQTDTRGQCCNRVQAPELFHSQATVSSKQTHSLQKIGETGKIIQVMGMN